eukprot:CCRYP_002413-RA/>CCRYP_002413-RA protein AED:0.47 eAED:0.47 QI:0/-1/0/1/-1/1/1/0/235
MFFSIYNRLCGRPQAALANLVLESSTTSRATSAIRAPAILRRGPTRGTSNRVHWDGIVKVKPIDLEFYGTKAVYARCEQNRHSDRCNCHRWDSDMIGGFRVCLVTDEAPRAETTSFAHRVVELFSLDSTPHPADLPAVVAPTTSDATANSAKSTTKEGRSKTTRKSRKTKKVSQAPVEHFEGADKPANSNADAGKPRVRPARRNKSARVAKDLKCGLDGMYWTAPAGPRHLKTTL